MTNIIKGYYWFNVHKAYRVNPEKPDRRKQKKSLEWVIPPRFMGALSKIAKKRGCKGYIDFSIGIDGFKTALAILFKNDKQNEELEETIITGRLEKENPHSKFFYKHNLLEQAVI